MSHNIYRGSHISLIAGYNAGPLSWSNWNLEILVFAEEGKPEKPEKNPRSKARTNEQQTQPTYGTGPESNPGHIGGRRALSPQPHPCSLKVFCGASLLST